MQITNANPETGIRYGVISSNSIDCDIFQEIYNKVYEDYYDYCLQEAMNEAKENFINKDTELGKFINKVTEFDKDGFEKDFSNDYCPDEIEGKFELENVKGWLTTLGGAYILYIFESPFLATANLCSPCCLNAGDLDSINPDGFTCYDVPEEWRIS